MVLKLGHFGKKMGKTWEVFKWAGERWRRSIGPIV
jgi:hypothetical protein